MTQQQEQAELCGLIPEENDPGFVAQHLSAYAFVQPRIVGQRVLEVGFGDGYGMAYLAKAARELVGVDIAPGNVPRAQAKYPAPNLTFQQFDGLRLPFSEGEFDAVFAFQVIEHIPQLQLIPWLTEIRRVLKEGGHFYLSTLNLEHAQKPGQPYQKLVYHEKEFTAPELTALLGQVFEKVTLFGLHPTLKHRFFRRLKRWGILVKGYFNRMGVGDFVVTRSRVRRAIDLYAICEK